jgi:cytochrome c oxidase subunit 2
MAMSDFPSSIFDPQAPQAGAISHLFIVTLAICAVIFSLVTGLIVYSLVKFRWREGEADPHQTAGNKTVEIIWTVIPVVIVVLLFAMTVHAMQIADPPPPAHPDLIVVGHQWWWEAQYPKSGAIVANEIHIPVGIPMSVRLDSTDVLHEFWVPQLTRKMTTVPHANNHVWLEADKAGTYEGVCSEYCGTQHAWMRFLVVAQPQAEFDAWQKAQLASAPVPSGEAAKGLQLFQQMTCISCHAIGGTDAKARVGPDLTHFASRRQLGSGAVENTPENLRRWLKNPQDVKPGVKMPNFNLTEKQVAEFAAYLETLK